MSWNVEEVEEGTLEFGDDGLVTAKGSNVSVCALESLPLKDHGIVYFELKLVDFPLGSVLKIGITQKTMAIGSFSVFKSAFSYMNIWGFFCRKGDVIGCGLKFGAGKMFITWNGKIERTVELSKLKCGDGTDQKLTVKLQQGKGCSVQLGHIAVTEDEDNCPF